MTVKIQGLEALNKKLQTLENFQRKMKAPMTQATALVQDDISEYKPKKKGAFTKFATAKQRRAYWARVSSGEINHRDGIGYVRSRKMGNSWYSRVSNVSKGVKGEVGNKVPYAPFAHDDARQQQFHAATGFKTDKQVLEKNSNKIQGFFDDVIKKELSR